MPAARLDPPRGRSVDVLSFCWGAAPQLLDAHVVEELRAQLPALAARQSVRGGML